MDKQDELAAAILNAVDADGDMVLYAGTFYTREATAAIIAAAVRSFMGSEIGPPVLYHETGGHEGDGSDESVHRARAAIGGGVSHELACDDCGRPNPVWFAPNEVWNLAIGGPDARDDPGGFVCPNCFIIRAEQAGIVPTAWKLEPEGHRAPLSAAIGEPEGALRNPDA